MNLTHHIEEPIAIELVLHDMHAHMQQGGTVHNQGRIDPERGHATPIQPVQRVNTENRTKRVGGWQRQLLICVDLQAVGA